MSYIYSKKFCLDKRSFKEIQGTQVSMEIVIIRKKTKNLKNLLKMMVFTFSILNA